MQASKRAMATAKEQADRVSAAAVDAERLRLETEVAADQLTRIIAAAPLANDRGEDVAAASSEHPTMLATPSVTAAPSAACAQLPAAVAAHAKAKAVADAMANLSPEQLTKLRRMRKLRALLAKVPAAISAPVAPRVSASSSDDAISMLASVACSW